MIVYIYNIGVDLYNGFNGLRHRINWTYFTVLDGLAHPLYSSSFCAYAQKNCYTTSFTHDITVNGLWFTTLGGNYLWLVYLQLNSCHARHTFKDIPKQDVFLISRQIPNFFEYYRRQKIKLYQ